MALPKAILVHADGTVESLPDDFGGGRYIDRREECPCGASTLSRRYKVHYASNLDTMKDGCRMSWRTPNHGCLVYIEEPA